MLRVLSASAATIGLVLAIASPALADPPAQANAATITKDAGCGGFVPDADGNPASGLFTTESHSVVTSSGVTSLVCKFDIPDGAEPAKATQASGFLCGTFLGLTTDSKMVASPGGNATLTCKINPPAP